MSNLVPPCTECGSQSYVYKPVAGGDYTPVACGVCGARIGRRFNLAQVVAIALTLLLLAGTLVRVSVS